jgi:Transposase
MMVLPFGLLHVRQSIPPIAAGPGRLLPDVQPQWKDLLRDGQSGGVFEQTYYRWRKEYGGVRMDQAKRMKDLEKENARLKRLLADAELDKAILREAASGNF